MLTCYFPLEQHHLCTTPSFVYVHTYTRAYTHTKLLPDSDLKPPDHTHMHKNSHACMHTDMTHIHTYRYSHMHTHMYVHISLLFFTIHVTISTIKHKQGQGDIPKGIPPLNYHNVQPPFATIESRFSKHAVDGGMRRNTVTVYIQQQVCNVHHI